MLNDRKITDWTQPVSSLDDRPQMAAAALKAAFDSNSNQLKPALNGVIDDLTGTGGAGNIGVSAIAGVTGTTVQAMLASLKTLIDLCDTSAESDDKLNLKADKTTTDKLVKTITLNADTGVFTIKTDDGTTTTIDTILEKIPVNCYLDGQEFVLVLDDGTEQRADLSDFLTPTEFTDSSTIDFSVSGSTVTATIKNGSITLAMLESTVMSTIQGYVTAAQTAAGNASTSETNAGTYRDQAQTAATNSASSASEAGAKATLSQSWAIGGTGTRAGEDTNNSKYFAQQSAGSASTAQGWSDSAMEQADAAASSATAAAGSAATASQAASNAANQVKSELQGYVSDAEDAAQRAEQAAEDAEAIAGGDFIPNSQKGTAGGVASLDASGKLEATQKPDYTAAEVGALADPGGGTAGQILTKTETGAKWGDLGASGGSLLTITFANGFQGANYTLTGGGQTFTGTVGNSLKAVYGLLATNTEYTLELTQGGNEYEFTITTLGYYKDLELSAAVVVSAVPTQDGTLTYTGTAQSPTWTGYDPNKLSMTGDTSKVNAGNYTTTFTPKPGCAWWDGTAESKNASWSISKAAIAIPTAEDTELDYTGASQHPEWENYDPDKITIGGDTAATDEGEYQTTFTPKENYQWTDSTTETKTISWSIKAGQISVPTVSGTLTYNGTIQSPVWSGYDTTKMTIGGQTAGVNAGAYTATFTPKTNYEWTDGTTAAKEVVWNIGKAVPVLTVSPASVELTSDSDTKTSAVTYNGDGTLSVQSQSSGIATATISGTTVTIKGVSTGDTTVTVNASAGANYQAKSASISVSADIEPVGVSFATDSWETIAAVAENGTASQFYSIGDTKNITISGVGTITLEIADFDHDYLSGSTSASKAGISMITRDLLPTARQMNSSNTNVGGFPASALYDYLNGTILNGLPSDLRSALKTTYKWYGTGNNTTNGQWHGYKVWIPLEYEMFGTTTYAPATEHTTGNARKYPIFTDNASRIKRMNNGSGSAQWYWEASPSASNTAGFCAVGSDGAASGNGAYGTCGVCFGLSI